MALAALSNTALATAVICLIAILRFIRRSLLQSMVRVIVEGTKKLLRPKLTADQMSVAADYDARFSRTLS